MKTNDTYVNNQYLFCVGKTEDGRFYLSIPVGNARVDYEEYYEIDSDTFKRCPENIDALKMLADRCRRRKNDSRLLEQPGRDRGEPYWPETQN